MADGWNNDQASAQLRAGVYGRESKGKGASIDDQDRENLEACAENGWRVACRYRDKVSASRFGTKVRDEWQKIIEDIRAGRLDVIVLYEVSRGDRTMDSWVPFVTACRTHGVRVHISSAETTYDPRKALHRKALLDAGSDGEYESEKISLRSLKGITGAALEGKAHGRSAWGYTREYGPIVNGRRTFTEIPNSHAPIVREIIRRVGKLDPIIQIERDLNQRGVPAPGGGQWHRNTIRKIVNSPTYIGMRGHNGDMHPGNWEPIVDRETWEKARAVLADPTRKTTSPGRQKHLLSYIASAKCGSPVHVAPGWQGRRDNYHCPKDGCTAIGVWETDFLVTEVILARVAEMDARDMFEKGDEEAQSARDELARLEGELRSARESYARPGGISDEAMAMKERAMLPAIEEARRRVNAGAPVAALALLDAAEVNDETVWPWWEGLSVAARRTVITALVEEIKILPATERLTRWSTDDERLAVAAKRIKEVSVFE